MYFSCRSNFKKILREELNLNLKVAWSSVQNRRPALLIGDFLAFPQIIRADKQSTYQASRIIRAANFQTDFSFVALSFHITIWATENLVKLIIEIKKQTAG